MAKAILSKEKHVADRALRVIGDDGLAVTAEMSVEEWIALPRNPQHKGAAHGAWTRVASGGSVVVKAYRQVVAAELGELFFKITGHSRSDLWEAGELQGPASVVVTVYRVASESELRDLYTAYNGTGSSAQYHQIAHAMQECGLSITSKRLRYGYILTALNIALRGRSRAHQDKKNTAPINVYRAVRTFSKELKFLDSVDPQPDVFYNGVIAAGLIALTLYPVQALEFFQKLSSKAGSKREGMMDPIESVLAHIQEMKNQRNAWITAQQEELCGRTLRSFVTWLEGEEKTTAYWTKSPARPLNYAPLIGKVRKLKQIASAQDL